MDTTQRALRFLIFTLFDLYIFVLVVRIILAYAHVNYHQPLTQFVVKATEFVVAPLKTLFPNIRGVETASIFMIFILEMLKIAISTVLIYGVVPNIFGLLIVSSAETLNVGILLFFYAILLHALLTWLQPFSPFNQILANVTAPIIRPIQKILPKMNGIDLSPIPALIGLQLLIMIVVDPLRQFGFMHLA